MRCFTVAKIKTYRLKPETINPKVELNRKWNLKRTRRHCDTCRRITQLRCIPAVPSELELEPDLRSSGRWQQIYFLIRRHAATSLNQSSRGQGTILSNIRDKE